MNVDLAEEFANILDEVFAKAKLDRTAIDSLLGS